MQVGRLDVSGNRARATHLQRPQNFLRQKGMYLRTGGGRLVASIAQFGPQALVGTARMSQKGWQAL